MSAIPTGLSACPTAAEVRAKNWAAYQSKTLRLNLDDPIPVYNPF